MNLLIVIFPWASLPTVERQGFRRQDWAELEDRWSQSPELHTGGLLGPQHQLFGSTDPCCCCCSAGLVNVDTAKKGCIVIHSLLLLGQLLLHAAVAHAENVVVPP